MLESLSSRSMTSGMRAPICKRGFEDLNQLPGDLFATEMLLEVTPSCQAHISGCLPIGCELPHRVRERLRIAGPGEYAAAGRLDDLADHSVDRQNNRTRGRHVVEDLVRVGGGIGWNGAKNGDAGICGSENLGHTTLGRRWQEEDVVQAFRPLDQGRFLFYVTNKHDLDPGALQEAGGIDDDAEIIGHAMRAGVQGDETIVEAVLTTKFGAGGIDSEHARVRAIGNQLDAP